MNRLLEKGSTIPLVGWVPGLWLKFRIKYPKFNAALDAMSVVKYAILGYAAVIAVL